jgi:PRTRC genetic system protein E
MFEQLLPLLAQRSLVITACAVGADRIRLTIITKAASDKEDKRLIVPFTAEGTPAELEQELPTAITNYASTSLTLVESVATYTAATDATLKEIKAENDKKVAEAKKNTKNASGAIAVNASVAAAKAAEAAKASAAPSLFDQPVAPVAVAVDAIAAVPEVVPTATTSDDDSDDDPDGADEDDEETEGVDTAEDHPLPISIPVPVVMPAAQAGMFDQEAHDAEEELLREVFDGAEDQLIAA